MAKAALSPILGLFLASAWVAAAADPGLPTDLRLPLPQHLEALPAGTTAPLSPEWIGKVTGSDRPPQFLRISHIRLRPEEPPGRLEIACLRSDGKSVGLNSAFYRPTLPSTILLKAAKNLAQLRNWLGQEPPALGGETDEKNLYWGAYWSCWTQTDDHQLRWLEVSAMLTVRKGNSSNPVLAQVTKITVREAVLRPANPDSAEEKKFYPSGDDIFIGNEKRQAEKLAAIPEPARALVAAFDAHDPDRLPYKALIFKIRENPDPALFSQIAALHETDIGYHYLEDLIQGSPPVIEPWSGPTLATGLRYAIDSLPKSHDPSKLEKDVLVLIRALGGEPLRIESPVIDLVTHKNDGGYTRTRWEVTKENQSEAAAKMAGELRKRLAEPK